MNHPNPACLDWFSLPDLPSTIRPKHGFATAMYWWTERAEGLRGRIDSGQEFVFMLPPNTAGMVSVEQTAIGPASACFQPICRMIQFRMVVSGLPPTKLTKSSLALTPPSPPRRLC